MIKEYPTLGLDDLSCRRAVLYVETCRRLNIKADLMEFSTYTPKNGGQAKGVFVLAHPGGTALALVCGNWELSEKAFQVAVKAALAQWLELSAEDREAMYAEGMRPEHLKHFVQELIKAGISGIILAPVAEA